MTQNIWHDFVDYEKQPETTAKNTTNARSRARSTIRHTLGRCSYNNKKYKLDQSGILQVPEDTTDKWLLGHQRKDGTVHPSADEAHKKVMEAKEKYKQAGASGGKSCVISDPLEDVFGANRKDCIRGHSSRTSKKQARIAAVAFFALQNRDSQKEQKLNKIETDVSILGGQLGSLSTKVDALLHLLKPNVSAPSSSSNPYRRVTPSPEKGSNTHHIGGTHRAMDNEEIASAGVTYDQVELLNNKGEVVALGSVREGDILHCKTLKPTEKKVFVEYVYDQAAVLWDAPQRDDYFFFRQLPLPAWIKWSEDRM
ncbi:hypothetical protein C5167_010171 [Papaver somniferum]|uniref:Uncharacterized protein n=1 Tax=Papaver somniferum TaxID=3469 RepID=A0A4Y7K2I7_PAPSO|nr:uncharacterized protein LOC113288707 [Papaver somniferum]RZC66481.1 hypothetical protein C5167_010171 [Papaver somniferum]